jgi:hypothetical protein
VLAGAVCHQGPHFLRAARAFAVHAAQHWQELFHVPDRPASICLRCGWGGGGALGWGDGGGGWGKICAFCVCHVVARGGGGG